MQRSDSAILARFFFNLKDSRKLSGMLELWNLKDDLLKKQI